MLDVISNVLVHGEFHVNLIEVGAQIGTSALHGKSKSVKRGVDVERWRCWGLVSKATSRVKKLLSPNRNIS